MPAQVSRAASIAHPAGSSGSDGYDPAAHAPPSPRSLDEVDGHEATVDFPAAFHWRELADRYFGDSFMRNVDMCRKGPRGALAGTFGERAALIEAMERWNDEVIATIP